jgi:hypothetical protein
MANDDLRVPITFDAWYRVLSRAVLLRPSESYVELRGDMVHVRMDWGFRASFPRSAIRAAHRSESKPISRGVHGFAGRWLVNGSGDGLLVLELEPEQTARVLGVPIRLRELTASVADPDEVAGWLKDRRRAAA